MPKIKCAFPDSIKAIPSAYLQDRSDRQGTFKELYDQTHDALQVDHPIKSGPSCIDLMDTQTKRLIL